MFKILTFALVMVIVPRASGQGEAIATAERLSASAPKGPAPRTSSGKPDLSGVWSPDRSFIYNIETALKKGEKLPLQPWAEKLAADAHVERRSRGELPAHRRASHGSLSLADRADADAHLLSVRREHPQLPADLLDDGRKHLADPDPTWYGDSIGSWDGDTMVVDSIGFNDKFWFDFAGHPHTEQLHVVERFRRPDLGHLEIEATITDPGAYTRPFTMYGHSVLQANTDLFEYICNENNQDVSHIVGKDDRR